MPLSVFRGSPKAERTDYVRDESGRVVSTTTYREAEWTDIDRALALALAGLEANRCPCGCNQPVDEAWDPENEGRYEVNADTTCYARQALDEWRAGDGKNVVDGTLPYVELQPARD